MSRRDYIADASFTIGLESGDKRLLEEIASALKSPCWTLFLGRKAFPLTKPPLEPTDFPREGRLEDHLLLGSGGLRVVLEDAAGERIQHDWPLDFGERRFKPRSTRTCFTKEEAI